MLQRILFLGALFQWRIAVGLFCIPPIICIFILATIAPESPSWLMSKGKDAEALKGTYNGLALIMQRVSHKKVYKMFCFLPRK